MNRLYAIFFYFNRFIAITNRLKTLIDKYWILIGWFLCSQHIRAGILTANSNVWLSDLIDVCGYFLSTIINKTNQSECPNCISLNRKSVYAQIVIFSVSHFFTVPGFWIKFTGNFNMKYRSYQQNYGFILSSFVI